MEHILLRARSFGYHALDSFTRIQSRRYLSNDRNGLSYYHKPGKPLLYRTVGQQLEISAKHYPNEEALASMYENKAITFPEVLDKADKFAAGLANLGIKQGDRVGIWMPNKVNWFVALMGIARLGGVTVCLNPAYQAPEIDFCIEKAGVKAMIIAETYKTQNYHKMLMELFPELQTKTRGKDSVMERVILDSEKRLSGSVMFEELLSASDVDVAIVKSLQKNIQPDDCYNIQFTSGSTGKPKATMLSHFNVVNNGRDIGYRLEYDKEHHRICLAAPFFHVFALTSGFFASLPYGTSCYLPSPGFKPTETIKCIQKYDCTYLYGTPTMHSDIVSYLKKTQTKLSLQYAVTAGAPVTPTLLRDMQQTLGVRRVRSVYGMTEGTAVSFASLPNEPRDKSLHFVGKAIENLEIKVVDPSGKMVPYGQPGELWVRGYGTMLGYYADEEKTRDTIGAGGWLKTGDQFVLHEDGYGQIVGRIKEMIIRGGENIFPKEIEDFLKTHPDIQEVYVAGVPDDRMGEEVAAFVKLFPGKADLTQEALKLFCTGKLAHFKVPRYVKIMTSFPKTATQKIQKFKLVQDFKA